MEETLTGWEKIKKFAQKKQNLILLLIILGLTIFWRLFKITSLPTNLSAGEYNLVTAAIALTKNHWHLAPVNIDKALYLYLLAGYGKLVGFKVIYLRILQAALGFFTVWLFYEFARNWFNRQTALLASLLFSASAFHIALSRELTPNILLPIIFVAIFYVITAAFRTNKIGWFVLGGLIFGLSLYVSNLFFVIPVFFVISSVYIYVRNPKILTAYLKGMITGLITFIAVAVPYFYFLPQNLIRYLQAFNPGSLGHFYLNLGNLIQSLFYMTPLNYLFNIGTEPLIDPFITITFFAAFFYALFNLKRKKFFFLLGWFIALLVITALQPVVNLSLLIILLPAIYLLAAVMMDYVLTSWVRTFPFNMTARLIMTFVFSLFLFMSIFYNYQKYFSAFAHNQEEFKYKIEYQAK